MVNTKSKIKRRDEIPSGYYAVCVVSRIDWTRILLSLIPATLLDMFWESGGNSWILIFDESKLLYVTDAYKNTREHIEHVCNNLASLSYEELAETYFSVDPIQLERENQDLLKLKWLEAVLVPVGRSERHA